MNINLSDKTYKRLAKHSEGFEKPEEVIEKLLNFYESRQTSTKPKIVFVPDEVEFKNLLLKKRAAWKLFDFYDGSSSIEKWIANRLTESSNLRANLWSGALRDWEVKGIKRLTLSISEPKLITKEEENMPKSIKVQVGKFVQEHLDSIVDYCESDPKHLDNLKNLEWSKNVLGLSSFPFLKPSSSVTEKESSEGRYWKRHTRTINGVKHSFCSQFGGNTMFGTQTLSERHGNKMLAFLKSNNLLLPRYQNSQVEFVVKG